MNRDKAFEIAGEALDLAHNLSFHAEFRNPKDLRWRMRFGANKRLLAKLKKNHEAFVFYTKQAYDLYNEIVEWADTYPLEGKNK